VLHRCTDINARPQGTKKQKQGNITPPKEANNFLENIRKKKGGSLYTARKGIANNCFKEVQ
jgi:hypothetical protein